jgi:hypothetical protein
MATDYTSDANCQGAWLFNDDLTDESGEGNTLTANDASDYTTDRPSGHSTGKSLHSDGSNDYWYRANADLSANFPGKVQKEDFSISVWIKHDDNQSANEAIMSINVYGTWAFNMWWVSGWDNVNVRIYDSDGHDDINTIDDITDKLGWRHYVLSFDGSATTLTYWITEDGEAFGNVADGLTAEFTNVDNVRADQVTNPFCIASEDGDWIFDGYIYQPAIFDRTLSAVEAEEIYTYGINGAEGGIIHEAVGTSDAVSSVTGIGQLLFKGAGAIAGVSALTSTAQLLLSGIGSVTETSSVSGSARLTIVGSGTIDAVSSLIGVGSISGIIQGVGTIDATSSVSGIGHLTFRAVGTIDAVSTVIGVSIGVVGELKTVGVRFTLASGDLDFFDDEILDIQIIDDMLMELLRNQIGPPFVRYEGDSWKAVVITFIERYSTTKAKIDQLIDEDDEMTLYPDYAYAGSDNPVTVIFFPNGMTHVYRYHFGELAANVQHKLTFLESS